MTVMLIKATPCVKQPMFKPRESVKFNITCVYEHNGEEWTATIVASTARAAISEYLFDWIDRPAAQGWIDGWETDSVVEVSAWPYGEERLEEVRIIYGRD